MVIVKVANIPTVKKSLTNSKLHLLVATSFFYLFDVFRPIGTVSHAEIQQTSSAVPTGQVYQQQQQQQQKLAAVVPGNQV